MVYYYETADITKAKYQYIEFLNNIPVDIKKELILEIYTPKKDHITNDIKPISNPYQKHRLSFRFNNDELYITKTCIVALMEDSKYIDAVCLIEKTSSVWPDGCDDFPAIMQKLKDANVWKSRNGEVAGPEDAVVTSSITSIAMSVNRREGAKLTRTVDDWYIEKSTYGNKNTSPK
jgi:hypothetical protein